MDTREKLLVAARELIQRNGYNGFSYADLAESVGIRKASIHHHFPTKEILGKEAAIHYRQDFMAALASIDVGKEHTIKKLEAYIQLFRKTLEQDHKVCLGIMLAADHESLPESVRSEVRIFFQDNEVWLTQLLAKGQGKGEVDSQCDASDIAKSIFSTLEGAMVIAGSMGDAGRIDAVTQWIIASVKKK